MLNLYEGLKVPSPIKRRGRPKGSDLTTVGLPVKRNKRGNLHSRKPVSFSRLHTTEKE